MRRPGRVGCAREALRRGQQCSPPQFGLPSSRWAVEVVTDNHMGLAARTKTAVVEIVVPAHYSPANGCKFKARALHYAAACNVSAARRHDCMKYPQLEPRAP